MGAANDAVAPIKCGFLGQFAAHGPGVVERPPTEGEAGDKCQNYSGDNSVGFARFGLMLELGHFGSRKNETGVSDRLIWISL
jgi:hypothetical protein